MEKQKTKASNSYRGKASDYYLNCSCSLRIQKIKGSKKQKHRATGHHHQHSK